MLGIATRSGLKQDETVFFPQISGKWDVPHSFTEAQGPSEYSDLAFRKWGCASVEFYCKVKRKSVLTSAGS